MSVTIIAEVGVNHNGNINVARALIEMAAEAGADIVKFQSFKANKLATENADMAAYQIENSSQHQSQLMMLKQLEIDDEFHCHIVEHCKKYGVEFLSTAFDIESLDQLAALGVKRIKIPSGEITHFAYLEKAGAMGLPIIMSTGMATMAEVKAATKILVGAGLSLSDLTILHCTTNYPALVDELNLRAMNSMRNELNVSVGYSDHSIGPEASIVSAALGASVIEKHVTLDRSMDGPDHAASMELIEFKAMVEAIRRVNTMLGDGIKRPIGNELENIAIVRKSLVAATPIKAGEILTIENIIAKRPATGLSPMRWNDVIGTRAIRDFEKDECIAIC